MTHHGKWRILVLALPLLLFVLLWRKAAQRPQLLPGLGGTVTSLAFSPDGKTLVCGTSHGLLQEWSSETGTWRTFASGSVGSPGLPGPLLRPRFDRNGQTVYAGGSIADNEFPSTAHAWDARTGHHKYAFGSLTQLIFDVSPNGRWAAIGYKDGVELEDLQGHPLPLNRRSEWMGSDFRGLPSRRIPVAGTGVTCVAFSPDSAKLVVGDGASQWQFRFWDVSTAKVTPLPGSAPTHSRYAPIAVSWGPDGKHVAAAGPTNLSMLDIAALHVTVVPRPLAHATSLMDYGYRDDVSLDWSPDGKYLFTGGDEVRQWRASDLKLERSFSVSGPAAVSPDGKTLATASPQHRGTPDGVWLWPIG